MSIGIAWFFAYTCFMPHTHEHGMFAGSSNVYSSECEIRANSYLRQLQAVYTSENEDKQLLDLARQAQELYGEVFCSILSLKEAFDELTAAYADLASSFAVGGKQAEMSNFFSNCSKNLGIVFLDQDQQPDLAMLLGAGIETHSLARVQMIIEQVLVLDARLTEDGGLATATEQILADYRLLTDEEAESRIDEDA